MSIQIRLGIDYDNADDASKAYTDIQHNTMFNWALPMFNITTDELEVENNHLHWEMTRHDNYFNFYEIVESLNAREFWTLGGIIKNNFGVELTDSDYFRLSDADYKPHISRNNHDFVFDFDNGAHVHGTVRPEGREVSIDHYHLVGTGFWNGGWGTDSHRDENGDLYHMNMN